MLSEDKIERDERKKLWKDLEKLNAKVIRLEKELTDIKNQKWEAENSIESYSLILRKCNLCLK